MPLLGLFSAGIAVAPVFYSSDTMGLPLPAHFELILGIGEIFQLKPYYIPSLLQAPMNNAGSWEGSTSGLMTAFNVTGARFEGIRAEIGVQREQGQHWKKELTGPVIWRLEDKKSAWQAIVGAGYGYRLNSQDLAWIVFYDFSGGVLIGKTIVHRLPIACKVEIGVGI
jgi:hypothetical protein